MRAFTFANSAVGVVHSVVPNLVAVPHKEIFYAALHNATLPGLAVRLLAILLQVLSTVYTHARVALRLLT